MRLTALGALFIEARVRKSNKFVPVVALVFDSARGPVQRTWFDFNTCLSDLLHLRSTTGHVNDLSAVRAIRAFPHVFNLIFVYSISWESFSAETTHVSFSQMNQKFGGLF